ncbi:unnamed protein product [Spirodela intermedia]|uniref:Uncharacterized protein n=1 Tax=Spirodela intermedia TaxID=51605 RepID=A0A7I8KG96_SPIIN|nr:unnamed protein product [Spirodela intermedia]
MDTEPEELQFLGIVGIFREAQKILLSWRKIFSGIALWLVLPLSLIFLLHIEISDLIFSKINHNEQALEDAPVGSRTEDRLLNRLASEWTSYVAFKAAYLVLVLVLSLLSTSAVVYTVACVYTAKEVTFRKVLTVVPKVWRRLLVTFLWSFAILFAYNTFSFLLLVLALLLVGTGGGGIAALVFYIPAYLAGLVYISVIWHLASVISVLEDTNGLAAMQKSKALIQGKAWVASGIFLFFHLSFFAIEVSFSQLVAHGRAPGVLSRIGYSALLLSLMSLLVLAALVVQTIVYFVCKSFHHESIDKSSLADHLEVYLGEYTPLKGRDVQLQQFDI